MAQFFQEYPHQGKVAECRDATCKFRIMYTHGGWAHIDTHGAYINHDAGPKLATCERCRIHVATDVDHFGGQKIIICACCMDELDRMRWAAEHGMPIPPAENLEACAIQIKEGEIGVAAR